jgi:tetratricopeptide (TPR) repeat protein
MVNEIKTLENELYVVKADANKGKFKKASSDLGRVRKSRMYFTAAFAVCVFFSVIGGFIRLMQADATSFLSILILVFFEISLYVGYLIFFNVKAHNAETHLRETVKIGVAEDMIVNNKVAEINERYVAEYNNLLAIQAECGKAKTKSETETAEEAAPAKAQDDVVADPSKTVLCAKCGAQLALNNEKRVYECNSCGVAYGISLFFGLPMEKALLAMNQGNYSDAEKRFTNILMVNPSDFEALLGRILCKGRWTKVSGIDASDELTPTAVKVIQKLVTESIEQALPEDKSYFESLNELLSKLAECSAINYKINMAKKKLGDFEAKERVYASVKSAGDKSSNTERMILNRDIRQYSEKKKSLDGNFEYMKGKLLRLRSDSVLAK